MDDKKETIKTTIIAIVLLIVLLAATAEIFACAIKIHDCYKNSVQVTAEIEDIAVDNQNNVQVTYKYSYDDKEYISNCSPLVTEMKRGDKKEIKISKTDKSEILPYESEAESLLPFVAIDITLIGFTWILWLSCVKRK